MASLLVCTLTSHFLECLLFYIGSSVNQLKDFRSTFSQGNGVHCTWDWGEKQNLKSDTMSGIYFGDGFMYSQLYSGLVIVLNRFRYYYMLILPWWFTFITSNRLLENGTTGSKTTMKCQSWCAAFISFGLQITQMINNSNMKQGGQWLLAWPTTFCSTYS